MKTITVLLGLLFVTVVSANDYKEIMEQTIKTMEQVMQDENGDRLIEVATKFERIGQKENSEWLPNYYAAYCYTVANYFIKSKKQKDLYIDKAELLIAEAVKRIVTENDEIILMMAYITLARSNVNPAQRARHYGPEFEKLLNQGHDLNKENPRYFFMKGENLFYTPKMFGGGKDLAKPVFEEAIQKYDKFVPESVIHPNWGKARTQELLEKC